MKKGKGERTAMGDKTKVSCTETVGPEMATGGSDGGTKRGGDSGTRDGDASSGSKIGSDGGKTDNAVKVRNPRRMWGINIS